MKFGKYLSENLIEQWKDYYVEYKSLKKLIASAELTLNRGISDEDEQTFIRKVEENVKRIEAWFLKVRNQCFERFESVHKDLPKEIKSHLPTISGFTSFQYNPRKKSNSGDSFNDNNNKGGKRKRKRHKTSPLKSSKKLMQTARNQHANKKGPMRDGSVTTSSTASTGPATKTSNSSERRSKQQQQQRVHVIDMDTNDKQQVSAAAVDETVAYVNEVEEESPTSSPYAYEDEDEEEEGEEEEETEEKNLYGDDDSSFNDRFCSSAMTPPSTLFIENAVFSHLPPSAHRECLSILLTLGKLKLFAWQNSEGIRKIIKKYDKNLDKKLTSTLWPKIKLLEFVQETKNDSYIAQVAAVLCTRTIPFGHLDANDLREKGVNLKQMADSIQQLEQVCSQEDLKEIVPMSVEPRSYMANERTFLKWMRMAALTTLVGMMLVAMRHEPVTGILLIILSIFVLIRSYHEYYKRNEILVNRIDYNWVDPMGPKLLLLSLFLPMITYLVYLILYGSTTNVFHK